MGVGCRIYLDTCIVIYLVEEHPSYGVEIGKILSNKNVLLCHSPLTQLEAMVQPLRLGRTDLVRKFRRFFETNISLVMPEPVYLHAAELRAYHGLKTQDALHLATAIYHRCEEFWTNDNHLVAVAPELVVNLVKDKGFST